jgi:hypothetical protein
MGQCTKQTAQQQLPSRKALPETALRTDKHTSEYQKPAADSERCEFLAEHDNGKENDEWAVQAIDECGPAGAETAQRHKVKRVRDTDPDGAADQDHNEILRRHGQRARLAKRDSRCGEQDQCDTVLEDIQCEGRDEPDGSFEENHTESPKQRRQ